MTKTKQPDPFFFGWGAFSLTGNSFDIYSSLENQSERDPAADGDGEAHWVMGHEWQQGEHAQAGHQGEMDWRGQGRLAHVQPDCVEQN